MKKLGLLIGICFLSLVCFGQQWDAPGFDDYYHLFFPNPYAQLYRGGGAYPYQPYRTEFYRAVGKDTGFDIKYIWNHNNVCSEIQGDTQMITPTQALMGVPLLWKLGLSGRGIKIGVLDVGYSGLIPHRSITIQGSFNSFGENNEEFETAPHTTVVLSIIAGRPNHGGRILGTAYNADIYSASFYDIIGGLHYLIDSVHCDIINMSFQTTPDTTIIGIIQRFKDNGGITVVAAGNNGSISELNPMCSIPGAVAVGGTVGGGSLVILDSFKFKSIIPYQGKKIDFAVPALSVGAYFDSQNIGGSTSGGDGLNFYSLQSGTSFCAPNIVGYLALLMEYYKKYPCMTNDMIIKQALQKGRKFTNLGYDAVVPKSDWVH